MGGAESEKKKRGAGPVLILNLLLVLVLALFFLAAVSSAPARGQAPVFHGNIKTKKFHRPGCRFFNCKNCVVKFATREAAVQAGYSPCKVCNP